MKRVPANVLHELRSPAKALADLLETFDRMAPDDPSLPRVARMIGLLAEEIARRRRVAGKPGAELGLY